MMTKAEAEQGVRKLCQMWAEERDVLIRPEIQQVSVNSAHG
jgi:hypothetical protein